MKTAIEGQNVADLVEANVSPRNLKSNQITNAGSTGQLGWKIVLWSPGTI